MVKIKCVVVVISKGVMKRDYGEKKYCLNKGWSELNWTKYRTRRKEQFENCTNK